MIDNEELFKETIACHMLNSPNKLNEYHKKQKRYRESYYLRNIVGNLKFYRQQMKVLPNSLSNDKLIYQHIQEIVQTFEKAKVNIVIITMLLISRRLKIQIGFFSKNKFQVLIQIFLAKTVLLLFHLFIKIYVTEKS